MRTPMSSKSNDIPNWVKSKVVGSKPTRCIGTLLSINKVTKKKKSTTENSAALILFRNFRSCHMNLCLAVLNASSLIIITNQALLRIYKKKILICVNVHVCAPICSVNIIHGSKCNLDDLFLTASVICISKRLTQKRTVHSNQYWIQRAIYRDFFVYRVQTKTVLRP